MGEEEMSPAGTGPVGSEHYQSLRQQNMASCLSLSCRIIFLAWYMKMTATLMAEMTSMGTTHTSSSEDRDLPTSCTSMASIMSEDVSPGAASSN